VQLVAVPDQRKGIRADPIRGRLDHRQRERRRDRRIDRIAAQVRRAVGRGKIVKEKKKRKKK